VLWIDDQIEIGDALRLLTLHGFNVQCVSTGSEGLRKAVSEPYAGIILDLRLPDAPGLAVLRRLSTAGIEAPVLVTGSADIESAVAAIKLGAVDYKSKPLVGDDLVYAVRKLVSTVRPTVLLDCDNPDPRCLSSASALAEIARRLARPAVGVLEFILLARSFRLQSGDSHIQRPTETKRDCWSTKETTLATNVLGHLAEGLSRGKWPSLDSVAQETLVSGDHINHILMALTNSTFRQCRRVLRVRPTVPHVASSQEQIAQIAYRHGYQWPGQLDRDFKATLLLTPKTFRRSFRTISS
jgi:DNA-binding response OmpR family regulator